MTRRHIAFFTNESKAHTYSTLAIAETLVKRGHRVTYATINPLAAEIIRTGAEAITYEPINWSQSIQNDRSNAMMTPHDPRHWEGMQAFMGPGALITALNALPQIKDFYTEHQPDVIIHDNDAYAGRILAAINHVPAIQISCYFAFYNNFYTEASCHWCTPAPSKELLTRLNQFFPILFPPQKLNIYLLPAEFQFNADSFDERFFFAGPCIRDTPAALPPTSAKPTIVVSRSASSSDFESDHEYFKLMIDALHGTDFRIILSTGSQIDPKELTPIPEGFEINQHTPQSEIIAQASLLISSGGTVSTFEALYHGIPSILIPQDIFHAELSGRMEQLGLGIVIKKNELTAERIRNAVANVLSDKTMQKNVERMQQITRKADAPNKVSDKIETFITNECLSASQKNEEKK